jgi:hypothetical protein
MKCAAIRHFGYTDAIGAALLCSGDGFRGLLESFELRPMQKLGNI